MHVRATWCANEAWDRIDGEGFPMPLYELKGEQESTTVSSPGKGTPFMNKWKPEDYTGAADNAMVKMSCSSGGTKKPRIRVGAANVMGLRGKGQRIRAARLVVRLEGR